MTTLKSKLAASVRQVKYQNSTHKPESSTAALNPPATRATERTPKAAPRSGAAKKTSPDVNHWASKRPAVWPD